MDGNSLVQVSLNVIRARARLWVGGHMNQALDVMSPFLRHIWESIPYDTNDHKVVESMVFRLSVTRDCVNKRRKEVKLASYGREAIVMTYILRCRRSHNKLRAAVTDSGFTTADAFVCMVI